MDSASARTMLQDAIEHRKCADLVAEEFPLRAAEHLLACLSAATRAVTPPGRVPAAEALPQALFRRASPVQIVNLTAWLQATVRERDRNSAGLRRFLANAAEACDGYLSDVEAFADQAAPSPGP